MTTWHMDYKDRLDYVFTRVNNRKKRSTWTDYRNAGYPMVEFNHNGKWGKLHKLCKEMFVDGKGRRTYTWFGHRFFFLTEEDAHLFRSLQLML